MILLLIYLSGVILSLGRHLAIDYEWAETFNPEKNEIQFEDYINSEMIFHLLSWAAFLIMIGIYFEDKNKYFLKFRMYKPNKKN